MVEGSLNVTLGGDTQESFDSWVELNEWITQEMDAWSWMLKTPNDQHSIVNRLSQAYSELQTHVSNLRSQGSSVSAIGPFLEKRFRTSGPFILSQSPTHDDLLDVKNRFGEDAAIFAFGFLKGYVPLGAAQGRNQLSAVLTTLFPGFHDVHAFSGHLKAERTKFRNGIRSALAEISDRRSELEEAASAQAHRAINMFSSRIRKGRRAWIENIERIDLSFAQSKESIEGVEKAYRIFMGLKAPVEYWKAKATEHGLVEKSAGWRLVWFFPMALIVVGGAFGVAAWLLLDAATVPHTVYFIITAALAMISGLTFWIGRLLNRLYLSAHHLRIDADERAVMTEAYLALSSENAATETDKQIILSALFRPTADGLVKDDGPDLTPAALLAKLGMGVK